MKPLEYWNSNGFEISSYKYSLKERINKTHMTSGSDNTGKCVYTYNELGFRGESIIKQGFKIMSLGCSITEGVGVNDNETWPAQFTNHIENGVNLNFGTGGRSNDFICRCLISYFDLIKPDLVLIMYTFPHRREVYTKDGGIEPYIPSLAWGKLLETEEGKTIQKNMDELQNEHTDFINWFKNHQLIKLFLESKNTNWLWDGRHLNTDYTDTNRFDLSDKINFGKNGADNQHPGPKDYEDYATLLYDYICDKFPYYLNQ